MLLSDCNLNDSEVALLKKGNFHTVADILIASSQDVARRCKTFPLEINRIVDTVLQATPRYDISTLNTPNFMDEEKFTTGDATLDDALGGGIRTGMVWEVVGESSAGKTQLALQLSIFIQAPHTLGGLDASACYLTTSSKLPTARLLQIAEAHELLSPSFCGLEHVHTIAVPTVAVLHHVITSVFPAFIEDQASKPGAKRVKLLVIDALAELFHSVDKTTTLTLVERSKDIVALSAALHELASRHQIAVLVLNEVIDRFERPTFNYNSQADLLYEQQSRWFNTAEYFGDKTKEASLGLVWANQINTRIMLSRTGRRRYLTDDDLPKRLRSTEPLSSGKASARHDELREPVLIRRLSVVFSNVASSVSLDYIVTEKGISILEDGGALPVSSLGENKGVTFVVENSNAQRLIIEYNADLAPVEPPTSPVVSDNRSMDEKIVEMDEFDDYLWQQAESYDNLDWDLLEEQLSQAQGS